MEEIVYTLIDTEGEALRARAEDGHLALLIPDQWGVGKLEAQVSGHAALAVLEGEADIDGSHWLAYRWMEGECLAELLVAGPLPPFDAVHLLLRLLDGVAQGRLSGHAFSALLAERIVLAADGSPLLAAILPRGVAGENPVLSAGKLLFHMLTAQQPVPNDRGEMPLLSALLPDLDPRLEAIVEGALGEPGAPHYDHVLDLRAALNDYLDDIERTDAADLPEDDGPVGQLMRRMGKSEDFPALSRAVGAIGRIADADSERLQSLAAIILRDFSLTNKVLRLANSASYGQFGGATSTISRAVMVLGFNAIKALAMTVVLIEHLTNHEHAGELKDEVARAFFASLVSRKLAERGGFHDLEEARVAGMFHLLGNLLALFYCRADVQAIAAEVAAGEREDVAVRRHLGMSFEELGMGVARAWNLPDKLISSMAAIEGKARTPRNEGDWLRLYANAGTDLMHATLDDTEEARYRHLLARDNYAEALHLGERDLRLAVDDAVREALREAAIFGLEVHQTGALARLRQLAGLPEVSGHRPAAASATPGEAAAPVADATAPAAEPPKPPAPDRPAVVEALSTCVQEVSETLVSEFKLNDLLRMILETLFRALDADRVLLATRSVQRNAIVGRFGFGEQIDAFTSGFVLPLEDSADVFRASQAHNVDILIEDADSPAIRDRIPAWFRQLKGGRSFLLLPIVLDRKSVGLFYADCAAPGKLQLGARELSLAKTLRNQAILAIRQKSPSL